MEKLFAELKKEASIMNHMVEEKELSDEEVQRQSRKVDRIVLEIMKSKARMIQ